MAEPKGGLATVSDAAAIVAVDAPVDAAVDAVPDAVVDAAVDAAVVVSSPDAPPKVTPPKAPKPDIADVGKPGEAVELVAVKGKITVFDFHASWCAPCKDVERELVKLVKANPTKVALRRVDVEDMDTPGALKHLVPGGFTLPHVKVFNASRTKVLEQSGGNSGVDTLVAKVRALVDAAK